ncbi:hypothetical protein SAMN04488528_103328 [Clostridium frigidicarnis]|uniref:Uncharacterized protein n=2 Tax=Clostridium frigidicarnis TaxID=84698 RepID=A0A1I1AC94_9CLOT|nr:hypothetical protein SAMN04488528_103328 [Clostridium frigidicarnis]
MFFSEVVNGRRMVNNFKEQAIGNGALSAMFFMISNVNLVIIKEE